MKLKIISKSNSEQGALDLPRQFEEPVREDIIKRAVEAIQANTRQKYGADPRAGKKCSAELSRRRRKYRGSYGFGISRVPRKILSRRGTRFNWVGAFAPGTVGGRRAHPPKAEKIWDKKININERRKAIRSAISATVSKECVESRGHKVPDNYPIIFTDDFENINKTKDVRIILEKIGFVDELKRSQKKTFRGGVARLRGRKYRKKKGPLLVVSKECELLKSAVNIPGIDIAIVDNLNCELLAPGTVPGRLTIFTKSAVERLGKENLFMKKKKVKSLAEKQKNKEEKKKKNKEIRKKKVLKK